MDLEPWNRKLMLAAGDGDFRSLKKCLQYGADVNCKDSIWGRTPLHEAAWRGHTYMVDLMISYGSDINCRSKAGETPLHEAAGEGHTNIVVMLLSRGGDISSKNNNGDTPYDLAKNEVIKKLLKGYQGKSNIGLPLELFQLDTESASVFTDLLKEDSYDLFELRSMLQGEQGTGKSSIARFLVGKAPTKLRRSTNGIDLYTGLSFFDDETDEWIDVKKGFAMEDITVSRCIKAFNKEGPLLREIPKDTKMEIAGPKITQHVHEDKISEEFRKNLTRLPMSIEKETYVQTKQGFAPRCKDKIMVKQIDSAKVENLNEITETEGMMNHDDHVYSKIIKSPGIVGTLKTLFGVKKEVEEIKISITKEKFFDKSRDVAKKDFHKRKIVPVTIWDFGGQDVFYSTHQTFLTYRAVYMLVLDGSRTLNEPCKTEQFLPGRDVAKIQKDYVRFWINTIITYCKGEIPGFPRIIVILTHKDKLKEHEIEKRRNEIFDEIEEMFDGSPMKKHLVIKDRIFVNTRNGNDPEMEKIKQSLMHQARIQPTWGQQLPKCFLPLELEIQCLVKKGYTLIHIAHMKKINSQQAIRPLTDSELKVFLKFQHSLGKILYFDEIYLDQHIIISPTYLIDAFKSIVTDQQFCKEDKQTEETWFLMNKKGIILKKAVEKIWTQTKYSHFVKSMEYLLGVMTHLDILVEPRRYDSYHHRIPTEFFYVASMVQKQDTTGYLQSPTFSQRNIALSFDISGSIIPPALSFRFISYCLSIWGVKTYGNANEDMLFHRSAVFTIDPSLDLHIQCEDERLIIRLLHSRSCTLIMRDLASSIRECLFAALHKISQLYIKTSSDSSRHTRSFDIKVCCSSSIDPCSIAIPDIADVWICSKHHIEHGKNVVLSWFTEKGKDSCDLSCPVEDDNFLQQSPTDLHLRRLALAYDMNEVIVLVTALGLQYSILNELYASTFSDESIRFTALKRCSEKAPFTFKDLKSAAEKEDIQNLHIICKVLRDEHISFDAEPEKWDLLTTDKDIDKLAPVVGNRSLGFLVELGLTFHDWEQIEYSQRERDLVKLNRTIMEAWRTNCKVHNIKPTLRTLGQAFGNIGINIKIIENILFN